MRERQRTQLPVTENWLDLEHSKELSAISRLLDDHPKIIELVLQDLRLASASQGRNTGAKGMTAEQVLRCLLVKQMNGFSYRQLEFHLADSRSYSTFCRFGVLEAIPGKSCLQANIKALSEETLQQIHRIILGAAVEAGIEDGQRTRVDCTVVESNIHHPTDSELLWDCVRVLTRLLHQARKLLGDNQVRFHDRTRRAKRRRKEINTARRQQKRIAPYRDLIRVAEEVLGAAARILEVIPEDSTIMGLDRVRRELERHVALSPKVIDQARRRLFEGETVPASEKIVSIFEDHTDIIRKDSHGTYYGHKVCLTAGRSSLILDAQILRGNPPDSSLPVTAVERLDEIFGKPPRQLTCDGAFASIANLKQIKALGVEDVVFAKGPGLRVSDMAKSTWVYKNLRNFRAGIEGIISFLKRAFGLRRCTWRSWNSFGAYVWSSILASNLLIIARHLM